MSANDPWKSFRRGSQRSQRGRREASDAMLIREGAFDVSGFQSNAFQVSCLMVTTDDQTYRVSAFLDKLIVFWREFLTTELNLTISST